MPYLPSLMFACKAGAYPSVKHIAGTPLIGKLLVLHRSSRLSCRDFPWTNTLAYYEHEQFTEEKSFITFGPGAGQPNTLAYSGITKGVSITVPLTSCLTGLESAV